MTSPARAVELIAPAKLTLALRITGLREDGYHLIDAEMVSLELADRITIEEPAPDHEISLSADGPFCDGMPLDGTNLVARALRLAGRSARVHVHKAVPHGGGLGGGSADAAAVLRWAGWTDLDAASRLGADIPFCLVGGRARVRGIGELVEPLPFEPLDLTLVIPPLAVSTPAAYRAWDELATRDPHAAHEGVNELEAAAIRVEPALAAWRDRIEAVAGERPTLAGSGATWFLRGHHGQLADELPGATVVLTRTCP